ncbi:unnamed protein product [Pieris macdunnoughi]|uniref:Gustatory receptor n=1 Tax=Pieris macdunnoughi TaxID=345717 RepID=A0A821VSS2_9NEOP|nr:unnamed protein product [Pieris macdunnoughi]
MSNAEYLSKDILEDQYIRSFSPFHYVEVALGTSRIHLRNRFVTSPTLSQKVYSLVCAGLACGLHVYVTITYFEKYYKYPIIYYTFVSLASMHFMTFACNIIHLRFFNTVENQEFYVQMQQLDRMLKVHDCINNMQYLYNIYTVAASILILFCTFICGVFLHYLLAIGFIGILYGVLCCALEWMHCASLLIYFYLRIRYINAIISNHLEGKLVLAEIKHFRLPRRSLLRHLASSVHDFESSPVDLYVAALFDAYSTFQNLYRFQLLLFVGNFFLHCLLSFFVEILSAQKGLINRETWIEFTDMPAISLISTLTAIAISIRCELFLREVMRTRRLCVNVLARHYDGVIRDKAKRILRTLDARPPSLSVYDMWHMHAGTLPAVTNILTTLMVAILQFVLL